VWWNLPGHPPKRRVSRSDRKWATWRGGTGSNSDLLTIDIRWTVKPAPFPPLVSTPEVRQTNLGRVLESTLAQESSFRIADNGSTLTPVNFSLRISSLNLPVTIAKRGSGQTRNMSDASHASRLNHGFPYRKEGRDSLPGSTVETPQAGGYRPGGFHIGNLMMKSDRRLYDGFLEKK
jgi:hypothetical protein